MKGNEVIWTGEFPITLSWRDYGGEEPPWRALFAGNICVGTINWAIKKNWRVWLSTTYESSEIGWFDTRGEAETALVDAALVALRKCPKQLDSIMDTQRWLVSRSQSQEALIAKLEKHIEDAKRALGE